MLPEQPPHAAETDAVLDRQLPRECSLPVPDDELLDGRGRQQAPSIIVSLIDELATVSYLRSAPATTELQLPPHWSDDPVGNVE